MSYPQFAKSLPASLRQNLRQPTWIATIASIGIHGVLWVVMPLLPISASQLEEPDVPTPVSLLELTPQEKSRLPDISTPDFVPPSATSDSDLFSLNPIPSPFPPIPTQPNTFSTIPSRPPSSYYSFPPYVPPAQTRPRTTIPTNPPPSATSTVRPSASATPSPTPTPTPSPAPSSTGTIQSSGLDGLTGRTSTPSPSPTSSPGTESQRLPEELPEESVARQNEMRQLLALNEEGSGQNEGSSRATAWLRRLQEEELWQPTGDESNLHPEPQGKSLPPEAFPELACQLRNVNNAEVWVGLILTPEGDPVEAPDLTNPELLKSSGYGVFNQKAIDLVSNLEIDVDDDLAQYGTNIPYWIKVVFQRQDGCRPTGSGDSAG